MPGDLGLPGLRARNWHHHLHSPRHILSARGSQSTETTQTLGDRSERKATSHTWHNMLPKPPSAWHPSLRNHLVRQYPRMPSLCHQLPSQHTAGSCPSSLSSPFVPSSQLASLGQASMSSARAQLPPLSSPQLIAHPEAATRPWGQLLLSPRAAQRPAIARQASA